jgi:hypothetical protein
MTNHSVAAGAVPMPTVHPVAVYVPPALHRSNRLTCAFRFILAIPHMLLVGGPMAVAITWFGAGNGDPAFEFGSAGVLGAVAGVIASIAWFAIVFGSAFPEGLWKLAAFYLHWRVRAVAYLMLLRDEYPPFGEGMYPAWLGLPRPVGPRDRISVAFRIFLVLPHLFVLWFLGIAWGVVTLIAWLAILFTGNYPAALYNFSVGVLRWTTRVEAYLLLLRDEYPPFSLD